MAVFSVFYQSILVGTSDLEFGDPPMGVAFGRFRPAEGYVQIQGECVANHADQSGLGLIVKTPAGDAIECVGVGILDASAEGGPDEIELNVLGISYPQYEELFPHHVRAYERQFKDLGDER